MIKTKVDYGKRILKIAKYIINKKCTIREAEKVFKISKSTIHRDIILKLSNINPTIYKKVKAVLNKNNAEKHIKGGMSTKLKWQMKNILKVFIILLIFNIQIIAVEDIKNIEEIETLYLEKGYHIYKIVDGVEIGKIPIEKEETYKHEAKFKLTAYCACSKCCGKWASGYTASGTKATQGRTIAVKKSQIPFKTKVYIDGMGEYIAEDTGVGENCIDIYFDDHNEALKFGVKYKIVRW